jgi:hypothetical protein
MKLFISQPMSGLSDGDIIRNRERSVKYLQEYDKSVVIEYDPADIYISEDKEKELELTTDNEALTKTKIGLFYFLRSIQHMVDKDAIVFLNGWQNSRGCILEFLIAKAFKLKILGEFTDNGFKSFIGFGTENRVLMNLFRYFK